MLVPKKSLSQNFLIDKNIVRKIIKLADIKNQKVIEIGPGTGSITNELVKQNPQKLTLIEKDDGLYKHLNEKYKNYNNVTVICNDILKEDFINFKDETIISNIPYNISSKLLIKILSLDKKFTKIIFMVQKEFALKISNRNKKNNSLNFFINTLANINIEFNIPSNVFYPKPKVTSSIILIKPKNKLIDKNKLYFFSKEIFSNKRKKISFFINKKNLLIKFDNIKDKRAEDLTNYELLNLFNSI